MTDWKTWTPKYDGHAPDDWERGMEIQCCSAPDGWCAFSGDPHWLDCSSYRYRAKQPDLLAQCLALPQADRDALIAELQKPVRDWADDVWMTAFSTWQNSRERNSHDKPIEIVRSMCLSKSDPLLFDIFNFLGGIDGAAELRGKLIEVIKS